RQRHLHRAVAGADVPFGAHVGSARDPRVDCAIAGFHIERIKATGEPDAPVPGGGRTLSVNVHRAYAAVIRMQLDVAAESTCIQTAVFRFDIQRARELTCLDRAVLAVNHDLAVDRGNLDAAIPAVELQVGIPRHVDFRAHAPGVETYGDARF